MLMSITHAPYHIGMQTCAVASGMGAAHAENDASRRRRGEDKKAARTRTYCSVP